MTPLPVIVGFGGINPAGRVSNHHAYKRLVIDELPSADAEHTYRALQSLMGLDTDTLTNDVRQYILDHTLIRKIELIDTDNIPAKRATSFHPAGESFRVAVPTRQMPNPLPEGWVVLDRIGNKTTVEVDTKVPLLLPETRSSRVTAAGQLPKGFNPAKTYPSRSHPRGLQMTIYSASDALLSTGISWSTIRDHIRPDQVSVYACSALGQCDADSLSGLLQAPCLGKRPTSKQAALSLAEMPADFVNAYVLGSVGGTAGAMGACATFLYNVKQGLDDIVHGRARVAMVGGAEAPIVADLIEAYRIMGAIAEDEAIMELDDVEEFDHRRACRPFSYNAGFTLSEAAVYLVLMDDQLAIDLGAEIYGSIPSVFINADGYKKSIPGPGIGNYLTVAKAMSLVRSMFGSKSLQQRSYIHAHGTGTPQNRVTESHILNELAKVHNIEKWPVTAVKAYLGHTLAAASGDQITCALGTWRHGIIPGIKSIDHVADDVHDSNLRISSEHTHIDADKDIDVALINSKGFGGNNATGVVISPAHTHSMLQKRYGKEGFKDYLKRNDITRQNIEKYDEETIENGVATVYKYGEGVVEGEELTLNTDEVGIPGWRQSVSMDLSNPYPDMSVGDED
ncbi:MAG: beta-ketoacyl synthase [Gammaproteobacteria bacterium]|nr:beta-ketoacyl synthase [Gammaproteobacteria bacterium]